MPGISHRSRRAVGKGAEAPREFANAPEMAAVTYRSEQVAASADHLPARRTRALQAAEVLPRRLRPAVEERPYPDPAQRTPAQPVRLAQAPVPVRVRRLAVPEPFGRQARRSRTLPLPTWGRMNRLPRLRE